MNELIKLADELDRKGLSKEADYVDALIKKAAWPETRRPWDNAEFLSRLNAAKQALIDAIFMVEEYPENSSHRFLMHSMEKLNNAIVDATNAAG